LTKVEDLFFPMITWTVQMKLISMWMNLISLIKQILCEYNGLDDLMTNKDSDQESASIPEYTAKEEWEDRLWRTVVIGEQEQWIDIKDIEHYKRVTS
jgi:hypothetical protein